MLLCTHKTKHHNTYVVVQHVRVERRLVTSLPYLASSINTLSRLHRQQCSKLVQIVTRTIIAVLAQNEALPDARDTVLW